MFYILRQGRQAITSHLEMLILYPSEISSHLLFTIVEATTNRVIQNFGTNRTVKIINLGFVTSYTFNRPNWNI